MGPTARLDQEYEARNSLAAKPSAYAHHATFSSTPRTCPSSEDIWLGIVNAGVGAKNKNFRKWVIALVASLAFTSCQTIENKSTQSNASTKTCRNTKEFITAELKNFRASITLPDRWSIRRERAGPNFSQQILRDKCDEANVTFTATRSKFESYSSVEDWVEKKVTGNVLRGYSGDWPLYVESKKTGTMNIGSGQKANVHSYTLQIGEQWRKVKIASFTNQEGFYWYWLYVRNSEYDSPLDAAFTTIMNGINVK